MDEAQRRDGAIIALGEALFFDPVLSDDGTVSCATCHVPERAFSGSDLVAIGVHGRAGRRNAPSILDRASSASQFWDGRAATLEEQIRMVIVSDVEFGTTLAAAVERVRQTPEYLEHFDRAFDDGLTGDNLVRAIAAFERTLVSGESPADRFMQPDFAAISESARRGKWIFESTGQCWRCHSGRAFTDEKFHNTGVGSDRAEPDLGRFEVTGADADRGAFKTPSLRNIALTAPYMHDGSIARLREVLEFYRGGARPNANLDSLIQPLDLSERDIDDLVAFLEALTSDQLPHVETDDEHE